MNTQHILVHGAQTPSIPVRRLDRGFSLVEIMLAIGVACILALGVFAMHAAARTNSQVRLEQNHIQNMARDANSAYGATGNFAGLTPAQAIQNHIAPQDMVQANALHSAWGGIVNICSTSVQSVPDNAVKITYEDVPAKACARLAAGVSTGIWDIVVNGHSVMLPGHRLQIDKLATLCAQDPAEMVFVFYGGASGLKIAQTGTNCQNNPSDPACNPIIPPVNPPPVNPPGNPCVAPPPSSQTHPTANETAVGNCPAGQYGQVTQSRPQEQSRAILYTCPAPTGNYTSSFGPWGAPYPAAPGTWTITSNTCAACPKSNTQTATQWVPVQEDCPSGIGWRKWTKEQTRSRTQQYAACPAGTKTAPSPTYTAWSAWSDTGKVSAISFGGGANILKCKTNAACGTPCPTHVGWYVDDGHYCSDVMPVCSGP